jgi:membrane fusion protein (multidrug efflux system)
MRGIVYTDDARLAGHLVDAAPQISGYVTEVAVKEGDSVRQGAVLFRLDPATYQSAVQRAEAALVSAQGNVQLSQAKLERALNGSRPEEIRAAEADLERLQNEEKLAKMDLTRTEKLAGADVETPRDLDHARAAYVSARCRRESAEQNLALLKAGTRKEDIALAKATVAVAKAQVAEAEASVATAKSNLAHCLVVAPFDGWVVRRWLDPGAMALPAQPVVSLFAPATLRVDANIEEKNLDEVQVGDEARIAVDAYPDLHLTGRVTEILRATNSQFSLIPAEGVSGTFIKVSQRVPLRIKVLDPPDVLLGPGLSVEVRIRTGSAGQQVADGGPRR